MHTSTASGNNSVTILSLRLNSIDLIANDFFSLSDVSIEPRVGLFSSMNDRRPVRIVPTLHAGFHVSGWKSEIDRHNRVLVLKLEINKIPILRTKPSLSAQLHLQNK
jgi:hypothetical protein